MTRALFVLLLLNFSSVEAENLGELLWEPGMKAMDGRKLAFPGAAKHGRAAPGAQRVAVIARLLTEAP